MRWRDLRRSGNVEDRRGSRGRVLLAGGGGVGSLVLILLYALLGGDPAQLLDQLPADSGPSTPRPLTAEEQQMGDFVSAVLGDTEDVWGRLFQQTRMTYRQPKLVLFTGQAQSACGFASAAMGPFYCPQDEKVYIDLDFYQELKSRFRAPGDFAQAYVIAHEIGHHVQKLLGVSDRVQAQRARMSQSEYNKLSVRLELQADFYAGVWAHYAQQYHDALEPGDIEEALTAASAIGDDNIQKRARGSVVPDSFTHGTGAQRVRWFTKGYRTGDPKQGDTFNAPDP